MKLPSRTWLRSVSGQLSLLGAVFVAAVVLAVILICLRGLLFEPYIREVYSPLQGDAKRIARTLAEASASKKDRDAVADEMKERIRAAEPGQAYADLERIYGGWITNAELDPAEVLPGRLTALQPEWVMDRLRRTLVVGNADQQTRALRWMQLVAGNPGVHDAIQQLAKYARQQGQRRGEEKRVEQADAVLAIGRSGGGGS